MLIPKVHFGKFLPLLLSVLLMASAAYLPVLVSERQQLLAQASRYNATWSITQAANELSRFEQNIAESRLPARAIDGDKIRLRFDILVNRLRLLSDGEVAAFTASRPERRAVVDDLAAALADVQNWVDDLDRPGMAERVLARLSPLEAPLTQLAAASNRDGGEKVAQYKQQLLGLNRAFAVVSGAVVLGTFGLLLLIFRMDHRLSEAHAAIGELTGAEPTSATSKRLSRMWRLGSSCSAGSTK